MPSKVRARKKTKGQKSGRRYTLVLREVADINSASAILPEVPLPGVHGGPVRLFILDDNQIVHRHFRYDDRLLAIRNRVVHWQIQPADEVRETRMAADGLEVRVFREVGMSVDINARCESPRIGRPAPRGFARRYGP